MTSRTLPAEHPKLSSAIHNRLQPNVFETSCIVGEHPARLCGLRSNFTFPSSCWLATRQTRPFSAGPQPFGFPTFIESVRWGRSRRMSRPDADSTYTMCRRFASTTIKFEKSGFAVDRPSKPQLISSVAACRHSSNDRVSRACGFPDCNSPGTAAHSTGVGRRIAGSAARRQDQFFATRWRLRGSIPQDKQATQTGVSDHD